MTSTHAFHGLIAPLQQALADEGYTTPTPIQEQAIPHLLAGRDLLGIAQTGTGKTAAFTLPLLQELADRKRKTVSGRPRALILAPTRELAAQVGDSIETYGRYLNIRHTVIFGGVGQFPQVKALRRGVDVAVATPGRLLDLMEQGHLQLDRVELFILDEVDRMLDMGFVEPVRKVLSCLPEKRHSLFFSATMPKAAADLAASMLRDPVHITIEPEKPTVERIDQKVMFVDAPNKTALLTDMVTGQNLDKVIVFTRTKHGADKVVKKLAAAGIASEAIHGNKSQSARTRALAGFKSGKTKVLVATDIAARGIDVDGITHVVNYDLPEETEMYVHRIGRTARAGTGGDAVTFCSAREREALRDVERAIRKSIPVVCDHAYHSEEASRATGAAARPEPRGRQGRPQRKVSTKRAPRRRFKNRRRVAC